MGWSQEPVNQQTQLSVVSCVASLKNSSKVFNTKPTSAILSCMFTLFTWAYDVFFSEKNILLFPVETAWKFGGLRGLDSPSSKHTHIVFWVAGISHSTAIMVGSFTPPLFINYPKGNTTELEMVLPIFWIPTFLKNLIRWWSNSLRTGNSPFFHRQIIMKYWSKWDMAFIANSQTIKWYQMWGLFALTLLAARSVII